MAQRNVHPLLPENHMRSQAHQDSGILPGRGMQTTRLKHLAGTGPELCRPQMPKKQNDDMMTFLANKRLGKIAEALRCCGSRNCCAVLIGHTTPSLTTINLSTAIRTSILRNRHRTLKLPAGRDEKHSQARLPTGQGTEQGKVHATCSFQTRNLPSILFYSLYEVPTAHPTTSNSLRKEQKQFFCPALWTSFIYALLEHRTGEPLHVSSNAVTLSSARSRLRSCWSAYT